MPVLNDITAPRPHKAKRVAANSLRSQRNTGSAPLLTAGELIALLQAADPAAPVVIRGQYGGFDCVHAVTPQPLRLNVNSHDGFGPHDLPEDGESADIMAVAIGSGYAPIVE
jgi:hypothetical protein